VRSQNVEEFVVFISPMTMNSVNNVQSHFKMCEKSDVSEREEEEEEEEEENKKRFSSHTHTLPISLFLVSA
jgi:hypothetical protein